MDINNMDGLTRADRMAQVNNYSNVLNQNIITTNTNINTINTNTSIDIRTISANAKLDEIISYQTPLINADAVAIILASNTQSASNILQITSTQTLNSATEIIVYKAQVTTARQAILDSVAAEVAALTTAGTPPTVAHEDDMYKITLGYSAAASRSAAETLYYDDNVKLILGFPDAVSVVHAEAFYTQSRINVGLGFPYHVNIIDGLGSNVANATAILAADSVTSVTITNRGLGYTSPPNIIFIGGGGTGTSGSTSIAYVVTSITIDNPGYDYNSIKEVKFVGGGGTGANALVTLLRGKVHQINILDGGSGYITAPTIEFINGNRSNGTGATATAIIGNGYVSSISITTGGSGYTLAPTVTFVKNSFQAIANGSVDGSGVITSLNMINAGNRYVTVPYVIFNGGGSGGAATVSIISSHSNRNRISGGLGNIVSAINLISGGTGYDFTSTITNVQTGTVYTDYYLKLAFGYPEAISTAAAQQSYFDNAMKILLGYPNATTLVEAQTLYFDMYMETLLTHPELLITSQTDQNQMYKDAFGFPGATSVKSAQNDYRSATMSTLLTGVVVERPLSHPKKRRDMDIISEKGVYVAPKVERKENQLPTEDTPSQHQSMSIEFQSNSSKSTITSLNIAVQSISHEERVFGRKPFPTTTKRSAMVLNTGHILNLNNPPTDINKQRTMSLNSNRKKIDRHTRINQCNNYTRFYKQAEAIVKYKIIQGANSTPPIHYTPAQQKQMLYDELKKIKTGPPPKQQPVPPPPVGKSFGLIEEEGEIRLGSLTHKERVNAVLTNTVLQESIEQLITKIEQDNGGSAISALTDDEVTSVTIIGVGNNFKYPPLVDFVGGSGFGASAIATLNADKQLDNINVTHEGIGYTSAPAVTFRISAEEKAELENEYWYSTIRARWKREEAIYPQPPKY